MLEKSEFKNQIQDYLKSGGLVTKLPPTLAGKTPSVGVPLHLGGWDQETLLGFGLDVELMEETDLNLVDLNDL